MNKETTKDEISIKELFIKIKAWWLYLLSQWKVILIFGIAGGTIGLIYSFKQKPMYTASLSFALEDQQQGGALGGALGLASQFGFDIGESSGGIFAGANLIELFKSRTMVEQTLLSPVTVDGKTISFAENLIQILEWRDQWSKNPRLKNIQFLPNADRKNFTRAQDSIMGVMYHVLTGGSLKVDQKDKMVDIISIDTQSPDEDFAKYFTEALAKEVSDFYILTKTQKARINMEILEKQTDSVRRELNAAITGVAVANDNTFSLNPALNVRRAPSARRQVDVQANTAILTELVKQTELAKVVLRKETPLIQVIDRPILPLKREKFGKLKGLVLGGFVAGLIIVFILIVKRIFKQLNSA